MGWEGTCYWLKENVEFGKSVRKMLDLKLNLIFIHAFQTTDRSALVTGIVIAGTATTTSAVLPVIAVTPAGGTGVVFQQREVARAGVAGELSVDFAAFCAGGAVCDFGAANLGDGLFLGLVARGLGQLVLIGRFGFGALGVVRVVGIAVGKDELVRRGGVACRVAGGVAGGIGCGGAVGWVLLATGFVIIGGLFCFESIGEWRITFCIKEEHVVRRLDVGHFDGFSIFGALVPRDVMFFAVGIFRERQHRGEFSVHFCGIGHIGLIQPDSHMVVRPVHILLGLRDVAWETKI